MLWCLGDWAFGRGADYLTNARWFRDQIHCRTVHLVWGNHDDKKIADLFASTHHQTEVRDRGVKLTLNHYPMLTWNGQHHATVAEPNIHLYGHVHALYQRRPEDLPDEAEDWDRLPRGCLVFGEKPRHWLESSSWMVPGVRFSQVGGHPTWIQDAEYPRCPDCERPMPFVAQLSNEDCQEHSEGIYSMFACPECGVAATGYQQS